MTRPIFLVTDFGSRDSYVGQVKAVIAGIAPLATVVDLTHEIEPFAITEGAWTIDVALGALPVGSIVMAVVDPGVGTERRALAVSAAGLTFVGPDNGVLSAAAPKAIRETLDGATRVPGLGELLRIRELASPQYRREHVSATFHGRDIFAPAAAHLALGLDERLLGPPLDSMLVLPAFCAQPGAFGELHGYVVHIDRFGNIITTVRGPQLFPCFALVVGDAEVDTRVRTFASAPAGEPFCYVDSSGFVAVALNRDSAAAALGVRRGDAVRVRCR